MTRIKIFLFAIILSLLNYLPQPAQAQEKEVVKIKVPYTSEVPLGRWTKPWNNACEEASMVMAESYYSGFESMDKGTAVKYMSPLFTIENKIFGGNADSDSVRTAKLLNDYLSVNALIKTAPTLEEIKDQLRQRKPVITFHYAKEIKNSNYHWRAGGSYYHVMLLVGFDDNTNEFLVHDSGDDKTGEYHRYSYDVIMNSLRDFNFKNHKADGPARVLFTDSKVLLKEKNSPAVYYIFHDTKYPIANSGAFLAHGWKWSQIKSAESKTIQKFKTGALIES
ncbi:MAG: C39 family peptidase [Candidatus Magasanikbacteria bacterium]|nr:C39 family peptidase [Candidatus Magasanikbacteria bacterium]